MIFQIMKLETSVIHYFHIILSGQSISENIIYISLRSFSRSKGQLQGQVGENIPKLGSCVLHLFFMGFCMKKNSFIIVFW